MVAKTLAVVSGPPGMPCRIGCLAAPITLVVALQVARQLAKT